MSEPILCPQCEKAFRWSRQIAGRKVRCVCGQAFMVPDEPDGAVIPAGSAEPKAPERETYELGEPAEPSTPKPTIRKAGGTLLNRGGRCPSCGGEMASGAVVCVSCGFNTAEGGRLQTEVAADSEAAADEPAPHAEASFDALTAYGTSAAARALAQRHDERQPSPFRETIAPTILLVLGVAFLIGLSLWDTESLGEAGWHLLQNSGVALVSTTAVLGAVLIIASLMGVHFGTVRSVFFKTFALGVCGSFASDAVTAMVLPILVEMMGVHGMIGVVCICVTLNVILVGGPMAIIFELDFHELGFLSLILVLLKLAGFILLFVFFGSIF